MPSPAAAFPFGAGSPPLPSRAAPRLSFEAVVRLSCAGRRGIHTGFVRDVSSGGMFLRLVDPEPPGRRLGFELFLPGVRTPARGVGEVVWQRPSYEGPGRPPGMAVRFVALEARAIEMLAAVLPGGGAPVVEVLEPRRVPVATREEIAAEAAANARGVASDPHLRATASDPDTAMPEIQLSLEALLADSGFASQAQPAGAGSAREAELDDELEGPMIFVPPPPLPVPALPSGPEVRALAAPAPKASGQRWGSAAAGIAAFAGLATLVVVGAARHDVLPPQESAPATRASAPSLPLAPPVIANANNDVPPPRAGEPAGEGVEVAGGASLPLLAESAPEATAPSSPSSVSPTADASPATAASATSLAALRWEPLPAGGTRVVITLDGSFAPSRLRASRIGGDSPRLVVRLLGLAAGAPRAPWEPATAEVRRIRAGRHDGEGGAEIHLVLDLASPTVRMVRSEVTGTELRLDLAPAPADAVR